MIRTAWFILNLTLATVFFGSTAIVAGVLRVRNRPNGIYDWCAREWARRALAASGVPYSADGVDRVPDRPVVFVSNHQSWFDIFLVAVLLPGMVRFVAKKELRKVPFLGRALASAGHIYIDRQNRQAAFGAYEEAATWIRNGVSACVFAEGTRSRTGELLPFRKGPFVMAIAAGVPVVPIYCGGTFTLLRKGSIRITPHPIGLLVGEPIDTAGMSYDDRERLMEQARAQIEGLRDRWQQGHRE